MQSEFLRTASSGLRPSICITIDHLKSSQFQSPISLEATSDNPHHFIMYATLKTIFFLGVITFSNIAYVEGQQKITINYGQQLQASDEANHWVAWASESDPCKDATVMDYLSSSPCDWQFQIGTVEYTLSGCPDGVIGSNTNPSVILSPEDIQLGACAAGGHHKYHCHGDTHDVISHGSCVVDSTP